MNNKYDDDDWEAYKRTVTPIAHPDVAIFRKIQQKIQRSFVSEVISAQDVVHRADDSSDIASADVSWQSRYGMRCVDLHGLTRDIAYDVVRSFLYDVSRASERKVLVITGGSAARGVLRASLLAWLDHDFAHIVSEYAVSSPKHGGEGAFYVFLKR